MLADGAGQALRSAAAGREAEQPLGQAEPCARRADDDVAAERELEAAAERIAADRGNGRLGQRLELVEDAPALELVVGEGLRPVALVLGDVGAGDEGAVARAGEDDNAYRAVGGDRIERGLERADQRRRQRVEFFGPVEDEADDARLDVFAD